MCVLKNLLNVHITAHDKIDLLTVGVTLTDFMWLCGDMLFAGVHYHHYVIFPLLFGLSVASVFAIRRMCVRHHKAKVRKLRDKAELELIDKSYQPIKHSER